MLSPNLKSTIRQKNSENSTFITPRSATKTVTPTESLMTHVQHEQCSTVIKDTEEKTLSLIADDSISLISYDEQNDTKEIAEFVHDDDIIREKESLQNVIETSEDKIEDLKYLSDLSVMSIIQFCSDYCRYALGVPKPVEIQNYIDGKVKKLLVKTKTAKQWKVLKVADFKNLSNSDIILLLQDYCTPTSRKEFYKNLKAGDKIL